VTDETRLHEMMADPGSAPDHDANGWPVRGEQTTARPVEYGDRVLHVQLGLGWVRVRGTATDRALVVFDKGSAPGEWLPVESLIVVPQDGDPYTAIADAVAAPAELAFRPGDRVEWVVDGVMNGVGTVRQYPYRDAFIRPTLALVHFDGDPYPLTALIKDLTLIPTDTAGPASSSASPGGTGGLTELLARLQAEVQSLAGMAQVAADVIEGQRLAVWDSLIESARRQEQVPSDTQAGYTMGWRAAHDLLTGRHLEDHEYEALLAAELDSRYGRDRAKGGEPRG
jgi:hypothetical protein